MKLTHIYQPLMIKTLLEHSNKATVEDIAKKFLDNDKSQLEYYKKITKRWPHITLKRHKVISYEKETYTLLLDDHITNKEKNRLIELCDCRLQEFVDGNPMIINARNIDNRIVSGSLRYDVFAKSKTRCVACGISTFNSSLHVDHIFPISRGGKTKIDNLQALCYKCNTEKGNRDDTDFIKWDNRLKYRNVKCTLCKITEPIKENNMAQAVYVIDTDIKLHSMVIPKRHVDTFIDLIPAERHLCLELVDLLKEDILVKDKTVNKFHVSFDSTGNKTTPHCCINIIPNRQ
ncbi:MAG: HNH endonuclease [Candidatus Nitrosoabyssus spongiisocia]|nr:MAG: HNH endonuclease [Nitrosopumilaceae archaeon AB1(1)]